MTDIPEKAEQEILDKLSANLEISAEEISDILAKYGVQGSNDALQRSYRKRLGQRLMASIRDEDGLREVLAVHNGRGGMDYIVVSGCNDAARLQSIQHRIQRQMEGMDNSVEKGKHRVWALERLKGKLYWR